MSLFKGDKREGRLVTGKGGFYMNAETTPLSREVFIVQLILPYQTYLVLIITLPALFAGIVKSTFSPYCSGYPLYVHWMSSLLPKYVVYSCMDREILVNV